MIHMPLKEESNAQKNNKRSKKLITWTVGLAILNLFKKNCICNHQKSALEQINKNMDFVQLKREQARREVMNWNLVFH